MSVNDRWPETAALMLVVTIPAALGVYFVAEGAWYSLFTPALFHGPLVLIAVWSALSNAPVCLRWSCGGVALWAVCRPVGVTSEWWQVQLVWQVVPHVLLTFTVLCLLRELGLRIQLPTDDSRHAANELRWRFTLRQLLGWVAGAAVLSLAWKRVFAAVVLIVRVSLSPWKLSLHGLSVTVSLTAIDLLALWAVLRPGRVRWRLGLFLVVAALLQMFIRRCVDEVVFGARRSWGNVFELCLNDLFHLGPVVAALFLVRWSGYRWTARRSFSP